MSEDLGAVAVTAGVNALAGLISRVPWSQISTRIMGVLRRRGDAADPAVRQAEQVLNEDEGSGREQRLAALLTRLPAEDLAEVTRELRALEHRTEITVHGGKNAINTGQGDQNVTFT